ncbi:MAG: molecular chaperone DnaJ [Actinobacteria bacterium]|nr:molecular chaperone DnaJ [Actinomycetota bacterium]
MSARDWIEKDFYKVLGVSASASADEIKKSYRKLAKQYHPDTNVGDANAEERFKEVSEAYDVLSSDSKRKEYDEARAMFDAGGRPGAGYAGGFPGGGAQGGPGMQDLFGDGGFGDLLGGLFGGGGRRRSGPSRGNDLEVETTVGFHDALRGATVALRLRGEATCDTCAGSGAKPGTSPRTCGACNGSGNQVRNAGGFGFSEPCRDCRGQGVIIDSPCSGCRSSGRTEKTRTVQTKIPAGIRDGTRMRLAGHGAPGSRGASAGDLYVTVRVAEHPMFGRTGDNITLTVPVTFPEAALGGKVTIPTPLDGDVTIAIAPGTSSGRVLRVKGKGAPTKGGGRGDLLATVDVSVPTGLNEAAKQALSQYAQAAGEDAVRDSLKPYLERHGV